MTIFTIDEQNNITAFGSAEEAAAATASTCDNFSSQKELAELAQVWPADRLVSIWNSLPGVTPVDSFKSNKVAASSIWARIQGLGDATNPEAEAAKPKAQHKAKGGTRAAKGAPAKGKTPKKTTAGKGAPKPKKAAKAKEVASPREGSKTAAVVALLERRGGATLAEIMKATKWQAHSCRGFISGTIGKKMGRTVESAKREDGERIYKITA